MGRRLCAAWHRQQDYPEAQRRVQCGATDSRGRGTHRQTGRPGGWRHAGAPRWLSQRGSREMAEGRAREPSPIAAPALAIRRHCD